MVINEDKKNMLINVDKKKIKKMSHALMLDKLPTIWPGYPSLKNLIKKQKIYKINYFDWWGKYHI